eukprot:TRINITY_DN70839_c0_g1_i1.p1 TRINITY_DN70839_c0_g1~~TRINITY_DN70839_c0_g1_i1.p1  ORF type:complete len:101 (+),score=23.52 TRINITY_DN70839_c0_g1_i1:17-319(+)
MIFSAIILCILLLQACSSQSDLTRTSFSCPEDNFDFEGSDISGILDVPSWDQCGQICALTSTCVAWTWEKTFKKCDLKASMNGARVSTCCVSGTRECQGF